MLFDDKERFDSEQKARIARDKADHISNIENLKTMKTELAQLEVDIENISAKQRGINFDIIDVDGRIENLQDKKKRYIQGFSRGKNSKEDIAKVSEKLLHAAQERSDYDEILRSLAQEKDALIARKEQLEAKHSHDMNAVYMHLSDMIFIIDDKVRENVFRAYACYSKRNNPATFHEWIVEQFPKNAIGPGVNKFDSEVEKQAELLLQ